MATAGKEWTGMGWRSEAENWDESGSVTGTQESRAGSQDVAMQGGQDQEEDDVTILPSSQ